MAVLEKLIAERQDWISADGAPDLVSIVVPTRNRELLLKQTLESLFSQTYRPIQLVIVDDGSQDNTKAMVQELRDSNPQSVEILFLEQHHLGGSVARNNGVKQSDGEFIVFMDDDDVAANDFIESRIGALLTNRSANLAYGPWKRFMTEDDNRYRLIDAHGEVPEPSASWNALLAGWRLLLQGCVIRRELVSRVGPWNELLHKSQDLEYKARLMAEETCRPIHADHGLVFYRIHQNSISGLLDAAKYDSYVEVIDQMEAATVLRPDYEETKDTLADFLWFHSFWLYGKGEFSRGFRELNRAKMHSPHICRRRGLIAAILDKLGLAIAIGPGYYYVTRCRKAFGLTQSPVETIVDELPTAVSC